MSDYTPTTERVREDYAYKEWLNKPVQVRLQAFDNWFAEEIRKAKADARPHIETELREQIVADIKAVIYEQGQPWDTGMDFYQNGMYHAARIVEGKQ